MSKYITEMYYYAQFKDAEDWHVVKCVQEWEKGWPRDISRDVHIDHVSKEYAIILSEMLNGGVAKSWSNRINFLMDTGNVNAAEAPEHQLVY